MRALKLLEKHVHMETVEGEDNMIIEFILNFVLTLLKFVFNLLPDIPDIQIFDSVMTVINVIFDNVQLIGIFVRPLTIQIIIPLWLIIDNFEKMYSRAMFVLKKIPILNIK